MSFVHQVSIKRLAGRLLGSEGMRLKKGYLKQVEKELNGFLGVMKKKLSGEMFCKLQVCVEDLDFLEQE
jgi:hypothetical protein